MVRTALHFHNNFCTSYSAAAVINAQLAKLQNRFCPRYLCDSLEYHIDCPSCVTGQTILCPARTDNRICTSCCLYRIIEAGFVQVQPSWGNVTITIAGLTNTYSSYVTTFEEYQAQRYEGASTIFGPHTLDAYIQVPSPPTRCTPPPPPPCSPLPPY